MEEYYSARSQHFKKHSTRCQLLCGKSRIIFHSICSADSLANGANTLDQTTLQILTDIVTASNMNLEFTLFLIAAIKVLSLEVRMDSTCTYCGKLNTLVGSLDTILLKKIIFIASKCKNVQKTKFQT